jgi:hypothetical protein
MGENSPDLVTLLWTKRRLSELDGWMQRFCQIAKEKEKEKYISV